jgi:hypothetical protein
MFDHGEQWPRTRALTGALVLADHNLRNFTDGELTRWFSRMRRWGIYLELEVGVIKDWAPSAEVAFRQDQHQWDRAIKLGADLRSIAMDEPLSGSRALGQNKDEAVEQTARFIRLVRSHYRGLLVGDIEPYPGIELQAHSFWLRLLQNRIIEGGGMPLDFYRLDVDWVAFTKAGKGNWGEVVTLSTALRKMGLAFSLIYWASAYPSARGLGLDGDYAWYSQVLKEGRDFADAGGRADQCVVESWINVPTRAVPESQNYTFTESVRDLASEIGLPDRIDDGSRSAARR